jgi:sulfate-transporting ATPase
MTAFIQLLILGLATGGFYTINALGTVVVFRSSGVINFASGGTAMVGGYLAWQFADELNWPVSLALITAIGIAALVGFLIYLLAIRPLANAYALTKVMATLAVLVSLQQLVTLVYGGVPKLPNAFLPTASIGVGSVRIGEDSLIILGFAIVLSFVLSAFYRFTRFGLATAALAEGPESLAALGWKVGRLRAANWAIGGALAGVAGAGLGPILQLEPGTFTALLIPTLTAAILGRLRSFPLTLAGGLLVGAVQAETERYITWNGAGDAAVFIVMMLVLVARGGAVPARNFVPERLPRVGSGQIRPARILAAVVVVGVLAGFVNVNWVIGATASLMVAIVLLSQVVITGYAGQLSLAQVTMSGVGAIVAANIAASFGVPFIVALLIGMVVVIPAGLLVGMPSVRTRGVSLAIATLGFAVAINSVLLGNTSLNGGFAGLTLQPPSLFGWNIDATIYPRRYFFVTLAVFTLLAVAVANMRRGRTGRRLLAVRNNERAASALGINVAGVKLYAFVLAAVIAGAAGVLTAFSVSLPQFTGYDPITGLNTLVTAVLGGIGYVLGPIFGSFFSSSGLPNAIINPWTSQLSWWNTFFPLATAVALVGMLVVHPDGIAEVFSPGSSLAKRRRAGQAARNRGAALLQAEVARAAADHQMTLGRSLRVRNVRVTFGSVIAVDNVSLSVQPGEVLAVIGPNGAGKTALLDAITGFVPMTGQVELDGQRIERWPSFRRARAGLARSFQSLELLEGMTVIDNLRCGSEPQDARSLLLDLVHPRRGDMSGATAAAIAAFGLRDKLEKVPTEIGYGDRHLVAIARAVAGAPSVLLLDEPAAGLSERERAEVGRLIKIMARDWKIAVLLIEHDVGLIRRVSDRAIALDYGRVIASGSPEAVLATPAVIEAYLGAGDEPIDEGPRLTAGAGEMRHQRRASDGSLSASKDA